MFSVLSFYTNIAKNSCYPKERSDHKDVMRMKGKSSWFQHSRVQISLWGLMEFTTCTYQCTEQVVSYITTFTLSQEVEKEGGDSLPGGDTQDDSCSCRMWQSTAVTPTIPCLAWEVPCFPI